MALFVFGLLVEAARSARSADPTGDDEDAMSPHPYLKAERAKPAVNQSHQAKVKRARK